MKKGLPILHCDFNAIGWSGDPEDHCFYVFRADDLKRIDPKDGLRVILYLEDSEEECTACEAVLEQWDDRWRAKPDESTWAHLSIRDLRDLSSAFEQRCANGDGPG